ncbi:hypothetical protein L873DRAFT_1818106 [Choiromyces venosus 120613-1]|uniref:Uncharacterized protein n=1 Tax=Choiromyces venosus 120613-1 TaxID=1336337 RepID=A0A3N4J216_9PEZI|nr:hypothetical protein L873DRAFT_1818106 [Choiromyces venosus 120613-1]
MPMSPGIPTPRSSLPEAPGQRSYPPRGPRTSTSKSNSPKTPGPRICTSKGVCFCRSAAKAVAFFTAPR